MMMGTGKRSLAIRLSNWLITSRGILLLKRAAWEVQNQLHRLLPSSCVKQRFLKISSTLTILRCLIK